MRTVRQKVTIVGGVLTILALLSGCGGKNETPDPTATALQSTPFVTYDASLIAEGESLFGRFNCMQCHSVTGNAGVGPALNGIYGTTRELQDGSLIQIDEQYLRESIVDPGARVAKGYPAVVMEAALSGIKGDVNHPDSVAALVAYIASLPGTP